ncbi:hypothetical protein QYM36_017048 [Artemia franciscana]|uniref:HAT C-terminal dimerisation domain-containing protein n=1 Tax=Artemia franciscana TaxID=6661 RepID=A0AA88HCC1_ARTSF|nr:hypothetical protein QYM36_017048 [Artemia franciscana]
METTTFEEFTKKMLNEKFYQQAFKAYTDNEKFRSRNAEINEKKRFSYRIKNEIYAEIVNFLLTGAGFKKNTGDVPIVKPCNDENVNARASACKTARASIEAPKFNLTNYSKLTPKKTPNRVWVRQPNNSQVLKVRVSNNQTVDARVAVEASTRNSTDFCNVTCKNTTNRVQIRQPNSKKRSVFERLGKVVNSNRDSKDSELLTDSQINQPKSKRMSIKDRLGDIVKVEGKQCYQQKMHRTYKYVNKLCRKSAIAAFPRKLQLYKNNIRRRALEQFPYLACVNSDLQDEDLALYGEYLENIHEDIQTRVDDLLGMDILIWVSIPFEVNVAEIDISLQEPLNRIQSDEIIDAKFKDEKYNIWKTNNVATKYPLLWDKVQFYVITYPTSYLVEATFSRLSQILSKDCNRLDIVKRGDLRLSLTSIEPNINKLAEKNQPQGSH